MIILDTHIWVWWVHRDRKLKAKVRAYIKANEDKGLGLSVISCWEVAKLVELNKLILHCSIDDWMNVAISYPGIQLLDLTPQISIESTQLPGNFHKDPADQIIVATARVFNAQLITLDEKILNYSYVKIFK